MNRSRLRSFLLLGIVCLAGTGYLGTGWLSALGLDLECLAGGQEVRQERVRQAKLYHRGEVTASRIQAKRGVVEQLLHHELTLFEAAAWFRYFNENPPDCQDDYRKNWPGRSDGEKVCRQVINWVYTDLFHDVSPSRAEEEKDRLERILEEHLKEHQTVELLRP
jgi:hypothetical protein